MSSDLISVSHDGSSPISESNCKCNNYTYLLAIIMLIK